MIFYRRESEIIIQAIVIRMAELVPEIVLFKLSRSLEIGRG